MENPEILIKSLEKYTFSQKEKEEEDKLKTLSNFYKNKALYKHVSFLSKNKCLMNKQIFSEEAGEIVFKSFSAILSLISGTYYPPRSKKILNLISRLKGKKFDKCTLGGCIVEDVDNFISVSKEQKVKKMLHQARNW